MNKIILEYKPISKITLKELKIFLTERGFITNYYQLIDDIYICSIQKEQTFFEYRGNERDIIQDILHGFNLKISWIEYVMKQFERGR